MTDETEDQQPRGANGRWLAGGPSANPAGRPKGIIDKRQRLQKLFSDNGEALVKVAVDAALEGDMQALGMSLARLAPPLKSTGERVEFDLDTELPLAGQANQILIAVSEGKLDVDAGRALLTMIQTVADIQTVESLHERVLTLEAKEVK
ncbi:DUF5681 domain-containing protein [Celeribacter baekdonensis]|uniref:DUF5681 domain-containing protein n=1 Tax=Celeribacter baekdonensis TaxID=875171 RepID=UPI0030D9AEDF|tara:strand:- start:256160 stop:256606 length:447 start_codon:yes stop_codon:yes gene_type:complete